MITAISCPHLAGRNGDSSDIICVILIQMRWYACAKGMDLMIVPHNPQEVIRRIVDWAERRESVRTVLLTSSRARPPRHR